MNAARDYDSIRLAVSLLQQDLVELKAQSKGKEKAGEINDSDIAIQATKDNLDAIIQEIEDFRIASTYQSTGRAPPTATGRVPPTATGRALPTAPGRVPPTAAPGRAPPTAAGIATSAAGATGVQTLLPVNRATATSSGSARRAEPLSIQAQPEASQKKAPAAVEGNKEEERRVECISCGDKHVRSDVVQAPCNHYYCGGCVQLLFQAATTDESLFPPRCCSKPMPLESVLNVLSMDTVAQFNTKKVEFGTKDRTYCHEPHCSAFIPPDAITGVIANCPRCSAQTCAACKAAAHVDSGVCPKDKDPGMAALMHLADAHGWQQCRSCKQLVELNTGCHHMTCRCGYQFCYVCGEKWKTCGCRQWDENRLVSQAHAIVNRGFDRANGNHNARIRNAIQHLRENHDCNHRGLWTKEHGRDDCDECGDTLELFTFLCTRCGRRSCRRCRYNRI